MKDIIWPERRKFLQRAPLVFAAGLALAAMPKAAKAFAGVGGSQPLGGQISLPALAIANGFTSNIFFDDFNSLNSIDVNNTLVPGFKWYVQGVNYSANGTPYIQSPASFSVSNSILTLNPDGKEAPSVPAGGGLNSVGFNGNGLVGNCMPYTGGYYGCRCSFDPSLSQGASADYWPAFWFNDASPYAAYNSGAALPYPSIELDIMEAYPSGGVGTAHQTGTFHQHALNGVGEQVVGTFDNGETPDTNMHLYESIIKTQQKNGGTGNVSLYVDGVLKMNQNYSSSSGSPTGIGSWMDSPTDPASRGFNLMLWTLHNWPMYIDWVSVCT